MTLDRVALPHLTMLSQQHCETIHRASLEILRRTGVRIYHTGALDLLRHTDALIDDADRVRFPPGLVEWALQQAPSRVPLCRRGNDEVVAYVAPIRDDYERPFSEEEYARFKPQVEQVVREHGATFANLESLVPSSMFGYMVAPDLGREMVPDFMHFQSGGHVALAEAMGDLLERGSPGIDE